MDTTSRGIIRLGNRPRELIILQRHLLLRGNLLLGDLLQRCILLLLGDLPLHLFNLLLLVHKLLLQGNLILGVIILLLLNILLLIRLVNRFSGPINNVRYDM